MNDLPGLHLKNVKQVIPGNVKSHTLFKTVKKWYQSMVSSVLTMCLTKLWPCARLR